MSYTYKRRQANALKNLRRVREIFRNRNNFTRMSLVSRRPEADYGLCFCIHGALWFVQNGEPRLTENEEYVKPQYVGDKNPAIIELDRIAKREGFQTIVGLNDSAGYHAVCVAVDEAIEALEKKVEVAS